jgi:hypothetical protein
VAWSTLGRYLPESFLVRKAVRLDAGSGSSCEGRSGSGEGRSGSDVGSGSSCEGGPSSAEQDDAISGERGDAWVAWRAVTADNLKNDLTGEYRTRSSDR